MIRLAEGWGRQAAPPAPREQSDLEFAIIVGMIAASAAAGMAIFWPF